MLHHCFGHWQLCSRVPHFDDKKHASICSRQKRLTCKHPHRPTNLSFGLQAIFAVEENVQVRIMINSHAFCGRTQLIVFCNGYIFMAAQPGHMAKFGQHPKLAATVIMWCFAQPVFIISAVFLFKEALTPSLLADECQTKLEVIQQHFMSSRT